MTITEAELFLRVGTAIVLGGFIGYERELREQPAGLRTHILVALASATFALVSLHVYEFQHYPNDGLIRFDGGRIASNIVVGIGFLGGGAILHSGMSIKGLTTAASLWLVAAIGLASGGGMFLLAVTTTVASLIALVALRYLVEEPRKRILRLKVTLEIEGDFIGRAALIAFLNPVGAILIGVDYSRDFSANRSRLELEVRLPSDEYEEPLLNRLGELKGVKRAEVERSW